MTPTSIRLSSNVRGIVAEKVLKKTEKKLLDIRIQPCTYTIKKLSDQKDILEKDLYENIPSAEKNNSKNSLHVHTGSPLTPSKQDRGRNSQKLQQKTIGFRTKEQKDNSDSIKKRWVVNVPRKQLT